jgi:hypothetical protein
MSSRDDDVLLEQIEVLDGVPGIGCSVTVGEIGTWRISRSMTTVRRRPAEGVALHVNLDKTGELSRETSTA